MPPDERHALERFAARCRVRQADYRLERAREATAAARRALDAALAAEREAQVERSRAWSSPWVLDLLFG